MLPLSSPGHVAFSSIGRSVVFVPSFDSRMILATFALTADPVHGFTARVIPSPVVAGAAAAAVVSDAAAAVVSVAAAAVVSEAAAAVESVAAAAVVSAGAATVVSDDESFEQAASPNAVNATIALIARNRVPRPNVR